MKRLMPQFASISGDGSFVVFTSLAGNLVPGTPSGANVYRRNRLTGTVEWLSVGAAAGNTSATPDANANGLSVVDSSDMSLVVSGTAAAANHAFGVGLRLYRDARGTTYQAPSGNVRLPRGIASVVQSVDGLDTSLRVHPHYQVA